jgi:hypothetical protein
MHLTRCALIPDLALDQIEISVWALSTKAADCTYKTIRPESIDENNA